MLNVHTLDEFSSHFRDFGACRIVCRISFEKRSLTVAKALAALPGEGSIAFSSEILSSLSLENLKVFGELFPTVAPVSLRLEPLSCGRVLNRELRQLARSTLKGSTVIDVTAFRREELLVLLSILHSIDIPDAANWHIAYNDARTMGQVLSGPVVACRSVLGYAGEVKPSRPNRIVVLTGFEIERARSIIDTYEPEGLVLGLGRSSDAVNQSFAEKNRDFFRYITSFYDNVEGDFEFSPTDPIAVVNELEQRIDLQDDHNVVIAPLNTKLSTIGVGLYALKHPQVQVSYATVANYHETEYSEPGDEIYTIPLTEILDAV